MRRASVPLVTDAAKDMLTVPVPVASLMVHTRQATKTVLLCQAMAKKMLHPSEVDKAIPMVETTMTIPTEELVRTVLMVNRTKSSPMVVRTVSRLSGITLDETTSLRVDTAAKASMEDRTTAKSVMASPILATAASNLPTKDRKAAMDRVALMRTATALESTARNDSDTRMATQVPDTVRTMTITEDLAQEDKKAMRAPHRLTAASPTLTEDNKMTHLLMAEGRTTRIDTLNHLDATAGMKSSKALAA